MEESEGKASASDSSDASSTPLGQQNGNDVEKGQAGTKVPADVQQVLASQGQLIPPPFMPGMGPQVGLQLLLGQSAAPQQNPAVIQHVTDFLKHDSDNKLKALSDDNQKSHQFRMSILGFVFFVFSMLIIFPLVQLYRGDVPFIKDFIDQYLGKALLVGLALLGGAKLKELLK